MGYIPPISIVSIFKKSAILIIWNFFFGVTLRCLMGRSSGINKAKLQFYSIMAGLYYGLKVYYASLLWDEFTTYIKHSKKSTEIASARFWSLIMHDAYSQAVILILKGV